MGRVSHPSAIPNEHRDKRALDRLLRAVERGQPDEINAAFEDIYNTYVRLVAFVCGQYLSDDSDIKAVTNDVFVQFFHHLNHMESEGMRLKYYLAVSAKNASLNHLRNERKHREALLTAEETEMFDDITDPEGEDIGSSVRYRELVHDLAACMDETALQIVLRHAVMGETFPAIGADLHLKPATVKTVYHRALAAFRREKGIHWI